jgi:large subunit ribosomal protein L25
MSEVIVLEAETRTDKGKGASRRLRRENQVPAIVYGSNKDPQTVMLAHNKVIKALEQESIYSSVLELQLDGKKQKVILKDLHRHPYKQQILHMDLQRVKSSEVIAKLIPLHFINEEECVGVKEGGIISHTMTEVEVRCQVKDLPEFIEVDMANIAVDQVVHLSDLKLPKGVELTADLSDGSHDLPVVSIHAKKAEVEEESGSEEAAEGSSEEGSEE